MINRRCLPPYLRPLTSLKEYLYSTVSREVNMPSIAIAFSGGVDSSLLAKICHDLDKEILLITTGFNGSHDIEFSKKIAKELDLPHVVKEISIEEFNESIVSVIEKTHCSVMSHVENCIAFYQVALACREYGFKLLLSANGLDELFCGYDIYRRIYLQGNDIINSTMEQKLSNEDTLVKEIQTVTDSFDVTTRQPFLSNNFIDFAKTIPLESKIHGPNDILRKHILREVAIEIGVPPLSANARKKALQYGSLIHKYYRNKET